MASPRRRDDEWARGRVDLVLQACLNGSRLADAHPSVPISPDQLARDAHAVAELGVRAVHVHPRRPQGRETIEPDHVADAVAAIRSRVPAMQITVPAARWVHPDPRHRIQALTAWGHLGFAKPDLVAINVNEPGWQQLCATACTHGIGLELGIWTAADAVCLRREGVPPGVVRVIAEVTIADPTVALADADRTLRALGPLDLPVGLHGEDAAAWPVWHYAAEIGLYTRIGLEDTLTRPDGSPTTSNADLVQHALRIAPPLRNRAALSCRYDELAEPCPARRDDPGTLLEPGRIHTRQHPLGPVGEWSARVRG